MYVSRLDEIDRRIAGPESINRDFVLGGARKLWGGNRRKLFRHHFTHVKSIWLRQQARAALYLATLSLSAALCVPAVHAIAARAASSTVQIYLYDKNGNPVNVTSVDSYHTPHVLDPDGNVIGTVGANDVIYNSGNQDIGYITETDGH